MSYIGRANSKKIYKNYYTKTQGTQINHRLSLHLSQPVQMGNFTKTITRTDR